MNDEEARARIAVLERRVLDGTDDRDYCLRMIALHQSVLDLCEALRGSA